MPSDQSFLLPIGIFIIAFLYSSVGHAGASGYIAVMGLLAVPPDSIKPAALTLNIIVAVLGFWQFWRAGYFRWELFWPFALFAAPFAFAGGYFSLPARAFQVVVGAVLLFSAARFAAHPPVESPVNPPRRLAAFVSGAAIGMLSGLTGTGGGIFLTPLIIVKSWAPTKNASAVSALFILLNSVAGLLGHSAGAKPYPPIIYPAATAAFCGGVVGSYLGSRVFSPDIIKRLLAIVLTIAGFKLIFA